MTDVALRLSVSGVTTRDCLTAVEVYFERIDNGTYRLNEK